MSLQKENLDIGSVQTALKDYRQSIGKLTYPHHYKNEFGLIRYAITGDFKTHFDLKNLTVKQRWIASRVICLSCRLIRRHFIYNDRKQACRKFVLKLETKK